MIQVSFEIPLRLYSIANMSEHWGKRAARSRNERWLGKIYTNQNVLHHVMGVGRFKIALTRTGPRKLDSDNLASSFKHVRDGIADALGINDGSEKLEWIYKQEISKAYFVKVEIEELK